MFHNPNLRQFTIQVSVHYHDITPVLPAVELEIPPDPLGRLFIGAPDGVTLTVRAEGTDPVVVELGQEPVAAGSRGVVFFGTSGTSTTATVTTSRGANNVAQIRVRGDASRPSAFHGDLHLTGSVGGSQVTARQVTVLKIVLIPLNGSSLKTGPNGNVTRYVYDQGNSDRFQQGNILRTERLADPARGGDQTVIRGATTYELIYQQPASMTDPRGLDPAFTPPIPDPSGRSQQERYTTRYFYDYQEADPALILPLLAAQLGISESQVQVRLDLAGVELGLGDLNGDGDVSPRVHGHLIRIQQPAVVLLPESNQTAIEGGELQEVVTRYGYNQFGQLISTVDPEGNVHVYTYFAERDPDGDGVVTPVPADGRVLDVTTGGYLSEVIVDTVYQYDPAGNMVRDSRYEPVGGPSPTTDGLAVLARPVSSLGVMQTTNLVIANLLEATERVYDELRTRTDLSYRNNS